MNGSRVYLYHCIKYSRKRVFPDPHSRIFYAVHLISETVFQINETNEKKRFFDLKILSLINFVEPLKKDFNFLQIYSQLLLKKYKMLKDRSVLMTLLNIHDGSCFRKQLTAKFRMHIIFHNYCYFFQRCLFMKTLAIMETWSHAKNSSA